MPADAPPRPLPIPDLETQPFWDAAQRGALAVQRCSACGEHRLYPKALCPGCHAEAHEWVEVSGRGRVYSFSVVRRAPSPSFAARVPYVVAIVALAEGPHLLSHIVGIEPDAVRIGLEVRVEFEQAGEAVRLPVFRPV